MAYPPQLGGRILAIDHVVMEVIWELNPEFKKLTMDQILAFDRVWIVGKEYRLNDPYQSGSIYLYPQSRAVGYLKIE